MATAGAPINDPDDNPQNPADNKGITPQILS
jgi:hypothetical protein